MNPSPDQEGGNVLVKAVQQIRPGNQQKRCLDIIIIKDPVGKAGQITDPGVSQGIEAGSGAGDEVQKKTCQGTHSKTGFAAAHQGKRSSQNHLKVRPDRSDLNISHKRGLQQCRSRAEQALYAIEEAKQAGFRRINADLMSGIPCQTAESFRNTMNKILQMNLSHISAYSLILEEGTPLERMVREDKVQLPDEEVSYNMYEMTTDILAKAGLQRYEISNYAAPGEESRHNIVYWHYEPYAAFGAGACSFTGTERRTNTADVLQYIQRSASLSLPALKTDSDLWQTEALDRKTQISEAMIMGLRMTAGVNLQKIQQRFGIDILESYGKEIQTLLDRKMAECEGRTLRLTPYGMRYGNRAFEAFI